MGAQRRSLGLIDVILLAVDFLAGCGTGTSGRSSGGASIGPREVKFSVDGNGGVLVQPDAATVTFAEGNVVVEIAVVLLMDKEVAKLPEDAKVMEVDSTAAVTLTITAARTKVHEAMLRK
jgi:hypothetical protein